MNELYTYPENDFRLYLAHHGIMGQKWGVRNAEWYPIAAFKDHLRNLGLKVENVRYNAAKKEADYHEKMVNRIENDPMESQFSKELSRKVFENSPEKRIVDKIDKKRAERQAKKRTKDKEMMALAKSKDQYNIDFLEKIQNDPVMRSTAPKKELLKEYQKYLDDPDGFLKNRNYVSDYASNGMNSKTYKNLVKKSREIGYNNLSREEKDYLLAFDT